MSLVKYISYITSGLCFIVGDFALGAPVEKAESDLLSFACFGIDRDF